MQPTGFREQFTAIADAWALAQGIVDTVREPVLVLDNELRVIAASRSFYSAFKVSPNDTQGRLLYALGDGQWDIPKLRVLLEKIIPEKGVMEGYEVAHEFPGLGHRTMRLNARQVFYEGPPSLLFSLSPFFFPLYFPPFLSLPSPPSLTFLSILHFIPYSSLYSLCTPIDIPASPALGKSCLSAA